VNKNCRYYGPFFESFCPFVRENFLKNYDKLLVIAKNGIDATYTTGLYSIQLKTNYTRVVEHLEEIKQKIELNMT
jgi:hypothetical protein